MNYVYTKRDSLTTPLTKYLYFQLFCEIWERLSQMESHNPVSTTHGLPDIFYSQSPF